MRETQVCCWDKRYRHCSGNREKQRRNIDVVGRWPIVDEKLNALIESQRCRFGVIEAGLEPLIPQCGNTFA